MSYLSVNDALWEALLPICRSQGLALYDVERPHAAKLIVVVTKAGSKLDLAPAMTGAEVTQGGVNVEDCSRLVRELMVYFQVQGDKFGLAAEPEIEVCSPGVNRNLRLPAHYACAVGERVQVVLIKAITVGDKKLPTIVGVISSCNERELKIAAANLGGSEVSVELSNIKRAHVDFDFDCQVKGKRKTKQRS